MTWTEGQDETNNTKTLGNKIKAGSVFLRSSTAHHHPDEFCHEREGETRHQSDKSGNELNIQRQPASGDTSSLLASCDGEDDQKS